MKLLRKNGIRRDLLLNLQIVYGTSEVKMNEEFSGGGQGAGARENKG